MVNRLNKKETRVKVKFRNGSEMKGRITQSGENSFTLTDEKTGSHSDIAYADVMRVEGRGMSKKKKMFIAIGAELHFLRRRLHIPLRIFGMIKNQHNDFSAAGNKTPCVEISKHFITSNHRRRRKRFARRRCIRAETEWVYKAFEGNEEAFNRAVEQVAQAATELLDSLVTNAPPRDRG